MERILLPCATCVCHHVGCVIGDRVGTSLVAMVIIGGISRMGRVTGILAPMMAVVYVVGALVILAGEMQETDATMITSSRSRSARVAEWRIRSICSLIWDSFSI